MYLEITSMLLLIGLASLDMTSATQCLCDTASVKTGFCNYKYSFRGTIMEVNEVQSDPSERGRRDAFSSYSFDLPEPQNLAPPAQLSTRTMHEFRVLVDGIYRGVDQGLLQEVVVIYSEHNERLCGNVNISVGNGYLFQVDDIEWLSPCARVIRYKDISREERYGLRKLYRSTCKSPN